MKSIKNYLIAAAAVVFVLALVTAEIFYSKYVKEKAEKERLRQNQEQYLAQNSTYMLLKQSLDEFKKTMSAKVDSILQAEKIKPKQVKSVVERFYYYRDTSYQSHSPDPVVVNNETIYPFTDVKDCFSIKGFLQVRDLRPSVTITDRLYTNNSTDIAYLVRPHKFLFIKYGKWQGKLKTVNQCGETTTKEIEIVK